VLTVAALVVLCGTAGLWYMHGHRPAAGDARDTLRLLVAGDKASDYAEKGGQYEIHIRVMADARDRLDELKMVTVPSNRFGAVPLTDVVQFVEGTGPAEINRLGRTRQVTINANMAPGTSQETLLNALDESARILNMGPEYVTGLLGIMVLYAVVKKNAILQIDHTNQLRASGMSRFEALLAANRDRLRPILMTTVAFVAGMVPTLISNAERSAINKSISGVFVGGQTLSLLLTLLVVPVADSLLDDLGVQLTRLFRRDAGTRITACEPDRDRPFVPAASGKGDAIGAGVSHAHLDPLAPSLRPSHVQ
jgi:multidrug efflux pump subunit AcrB